MIHPPKVAVLYGGPPVVGKDTQTEAFRQLNVPVFETGARLREYALKNPGSPVAIAMKNQLLVDYSDVLWDAKKWIFEHTGRKMIKLNGLPRKPTQMPIINRLREHGFLVKAVWFTTPIENCMARPYREDRLDDTPAKRSARMETYVKETLPVLHNFGEYNIREDNGSLLLINNADLKKEDVAAQIIKFLNLPTTVTELFPNVERPNQNGSHAAVHLPV
jgi:adenylate kinase family enzyme